MLIKHIVGWLIFTLITIFGLPAIVSPQSYKNEVKKEREVLTTNMGAESANKIILYADEVYTETFEDSGIHQSFMEHYSIPEKEILNGTPIQNDPLAPDPTAKYQRKLQGYFVSLFISFYEWIFRTVQLLMWSAFTLPFLMAACWDGMMLRKVKAASFIYSSPAMYSGMWHALIAMCFGINWVLNMPIPINPLLYPVVITILALLIRTLISNLQRSA